MAFDWTSSANFTSVPTCFVKTVALLDIEYESKGFRNIKNVSARYVAKKWIDDVKKSRV